MTRDSKLSVLLLTSLLLAGCSGDGPDLSTNTASLTLTITDAPIDEANAVWIKFTGIELKPESDNPFSINFNTPQLINLMALQGSDFAFLLENKGISSGTYNWMRLKLDAQSDAMDSYIELSNGNQYPLYIPSGNEIGLKLNQSFTIPHNGNLDLTIDFDLRKSIVAQQSGNYILKPSLRLLHTDNTGHIKGTISTTTLQHSLCTGTDYAIYAYEGENITPDDVDGLGEEPITTSLVHIDSQSRYAYNLGFLDEGLYTVTFTCNASDDTPSNSETLNYIGTINATVTAGATANYNF